MQKVINKDLLCHFFVIVYAYIILEAFSHLRISDGVDARWSHTKPRSPVRQARTALIWAKACQSIWPVNWQGNSKPSNSRVYRLDFRITLTRGIGKALPIRKATKDRIRWACNKSDLLRIGNKLPMSMSNQTARSKADTCRVTMYKPTNVWIWTKLSLWFNLIGFTRFTVINKELTAD